MKNSPFKKKIRTPSIFFYIAVPLIFFSACSSNENSILSINPSVVFEYETQDSKPNLSLSVFIQTEGKAQRAESLKISSKQNSLYWIVQNSIIFENAGKNWLGYTSLKIPEGFSLENGIYTVTYTDALGEEFLGSFSLSYRKEILESDVSSIREKAGVPLSENYVLFDEDMNMLYYGAKKTSWKDANDMIKEYKSAFYLRKMLSTVSGSLVFVTPVENLRGEEKEKTLEQAEN